MSDEHIVCEHCGYKELKSRSEQCECGSWYCRFSCLAKGLWKVGIKVLGEIVSGLLVAWLLSLFGFDDLVIEMFSQFGFSITTGTYYVLFAILGILVIGPSRRDRD